MPFLRTLGLPELVGEDGSAVDGLRLKDLALLAYLCVEGDRAHPRARLAALLWGESPEEAARHSFTQAIGRIQKALGRGALGVQKESVRWTGCVASDAGALLADDPWHPCLDDGLTLYRSDFLDGFEPGEGGEEFERWAEGTRARLRNLALRALERRGEDAEARGEWERALRTGERAVQIDPLWESGHRRVMRALAERGEVNRALRHYEGFRAWLAEEVDGEPDPETRRVAERLRARDCADRSAGAPEETRRTRGKYTAGAGFAPWNRQREVVYVILLVLPTLVAFSVVEALVPDRVPLQPALREHSLLVAPPEHDTVRHLHPAFLAEFSPESRPAHTGVGKGTVFLLGQVGARKAPPSADTSLRRGGRTFLRARAESAGLPVREPGIRLAPPSPGSLVIQMAPTTTRRLEAGAPATARLDVTSTHPVREPGALIRGPDGSIHSVLYHGGALHVATDRGLAPSCRAGAEAVDAPHEELLFYCATGEFPPCAPELR